jgi:hypothetical protein
MMLVGNGERGSEGGLRGEGACNRLQGLGDKCRGRRMWACIERTFCRLYFSILGRRGGVQGSACAMQH